MPSFFSNRVDESALLNPGVLRHQIQWVRQTVTGQDAFGQDVTTPTVVLTCRAQIKSLQGRELFAAQQRWGDARYRIVQHYTAGLRVEDQIEWFVDGELRTLDVLDIGDAGGNGRVQTIYAKDHVA